ncbi:MAG: ABC transporter ATP-binding protein [Firmicutes bacterium]|nr:ABC transporter ATP-binding protein [Bacillota bacterium]
MNSLLPVITMTNVSKKYRLRTAIEEINYTFHTGKLYVITGPNGSGKSTILKCIMGLLRYDGQIDMKHVSIGYAPEQYILPEHLTVEEFLVNLGRVKSKEVHSINHRLIPLLEAFHMLEASNQSIRTLSNGMKQKVNLIQAFIHQPKVLLLDEPFRAIDEASKIELVEMIKQRIPDTLIIISTHQPQSIKVKQKKTVKIMNGRIN